ncbi:DegQ family serine endoprotease [Helicobacter sp. 11S02629-2]|uniref:DegQ family serine endoprotease n=1 Tax=Helicobacter sp. 11S02629-2 TaxID=1476195 RepID=UPI000BA7B894|nr:DegQ family serine endoprotease [Helicobacter sp. 11S02629-2]PAF46065.1 serine protease [Helicobacter sp. 11S02629-2]
MKKLTYVMVACALSASLQAFSITEMPSTSNRVMPSNHGSIYSYHDSIKDASKAVVNITTEQKVKDNNSPFNDPFFQQFFGNMMPPQMQNREQTGLGSGVIMTSDGYIVTNYHVVKGADKITVTLPGDNKKYKAKLIGKDPQSDIAVIKIEKKNLPVIKFADSNTYKVGDVVFAIGNPFGIGESVTQGIVSGLNKHGFGISNYENFIQTDASINPGNSGGALVDSRGALIGINTAIISRTGGNNGIGFAIPSDMVRNIATTLVKDGKVQRGFLGVMMKDLDSSLASSYDNKEGALVIQISPDSPAKKAGIQVWDLITAVDGKPIKGSADLKNTIGAYAPNTKITLTIMRNKKLEKISLTLAKQQNDDDGFTTMDNGSQSESTEGISGLSVAPLDNQVRQLYNIPDDIHGVIVNNVKPNSKADLAGFSKGDIISRVENDDIKNISDFNKAMHKYKGKMKRILAYNIDGTVKAITLN